MNSQNPVAPHSSAADTRTRSARPSDKLTKPGQTGSGEGRNAGDLRRRSQLVMHIGFLFCSLGVLVLAAVLRINEHGQVGLPWGGLSSGMPPLCMFRRLFDIDCPGCGLTRCFVSMAHGNMAAAWAFHPVGIVFFAVVVAQLPYRGLQISRLLRGNDEIPAMTWAPWLAASLGVLLIGQWVVRMVV